MQALASLFACGQPAGVHAAGGTASPRRVPEKEKEPDKRAVLIGIKKYDFIGLRFQMMREILWFNIRGIFLLVIVRCFFLGIDKNK